MARLPMRTPSRSVTSPRASNIHTDVVTDQGRSQDRPWSDRVPQPVAGLELIGQYEGSGLKEPPYLVRRADGQIVQISELLFSITSLIDGRRTLDEIATEIEDRQGRE